MHRQAIRVCFEPPCGAEKEKRKLSRGEQARKGRGVQMQDVSGGEVMYRRDLLFLPGRWTGPQQIRERAPSEEYYYWDRGRTAGAIIEEGTNLVAM